MRFYKFIIFLLLLLLLQTAVMSQGKTIGAGLVLGQPTGLSGKFWINEQNAFDAAVAWSFLDGFMHIHGDYLFHFIDLFPIPKGELPLHVGAGARIQLTPSLPQIGLRVPVGINYMFEEIPLEIFLEIAFILDLIPATTAAGGGGIGIRYYF